ncbi:hypothetical protein [Patulibacter minatonensis]|uniref:hypothetical protein n=1 Tax=Patulibacter minatonensis TaxID=298163 RepID=UPI0012FAECCD|nr:hypothetical protein [Patulibacter minatonensis]
MSDERAADDEATGVPDGEGLPGGGSGDRDRGSSHPVMNLWRRSYGASPAHLLLHLGGIALAAWALSQSFDGRYSAAYGNLVVWMVGGAILNDFVALPLYVGADKAARFVWGLVRGARPGVAVAAPPRSAPPRVLGNGHVRVPLVMSAVLLLVYFPNVAHKAPLNHTLATGLAEQPDYAGRWLAITAGLMIVSALLYLARLARARTRTATTT